MAAAVADAVRACICSSVSPGGPPGSVSFSVHDSSALARLTVIDRVDIELRQDVGVERLA